MKVCCLRWHICTHTARESHIVLLPAQLQAEASAWCFIVAVGVVVDAAVGAVFGVSGST